MDKNNSLVKVPTTSIQRVSKQLVITNKLLNERNSKLRIWWESLDGLWQDIFIKNLECASELKRNSIEGMIGWSGLNFTKPQRIKTEQLKEISLLKELYCESAEISSLEPIRNLTNLQVLKCGYTEISSLEPIRNLTNLQVLGCDNT